jgi:hypothetical protein
VNKSALDILNEAWVGKTIVECEYDDYGDYVGHVIKSLALFGEENYAKIALHLDDGSSYELHDNENLEVK